MILPSKHLPQDRALLTIGARILACLNQSKTVSALWEEISNKVRLSKHNIPPIPFDSMVLALDLLFLIGAVELIDGRIVRNQS